MSFSQALSGLSAQADNIKVISHSIANSQTVGFKSGRASFADIFAGSNDIGLGVRVAGVSQDFKSGSLENTARELDLAIVGEGFFRLEKMNGEIVYSRNGEINQDAQGFLVNTTGHRLTGFGLSDPADPFSAVIPGGGAPEAIRIPPDDLPANPTTEANVIHNLDASLVAGQGLQSAPVIVDNTTVPPTTVDLEFHYMSSYTTYDSLGNERTVTTYYEKLADNKWAARVTLDGERPGGFADDSYIQGGAVQITPAPDFVLNFNENGTLQKYYAIPGDPTSPVVSQGINPVEFLVNLDSIPPTGQPFPDVDGVASRGSASDGTGSDLAQALFTLTFDNTQFDLDGADTLAYNLNLTGTTQYNNDSKLTRLDQNGYTSGTLIGLEVSEEGRVVRIFTNEERRDAGQVALAHFRNSEGLRPDGDNAWLQTEASGLPVIGSAGTGILGTIESQTLETSNVDLAQKLVDMIVAQRAYQANSSSIGTQDEALQTILNL